MKAFFERFSQACQPPSQSFDIYGIRDQPRLSSRFRGQFESALQDYERQTGTNLVDHPLTRRLYGFRNVEDVVGVLREQAQGIDDFCGDNYDADDGGLMKPLRGVVYELYNLSISTVLGEVIDLVRQRMQMRVSCLKYSSITISS